ncbi:MAG TPA: hypothetical protein VJU52_06625, partial [Flavobacterium sp.]|nr:hypothetical protein [Flavobacterium sp.]
MKKNSKTMPRRKPKKKKSIFSGRWIDFFFIGIAILFIFSVAYHYRSGLANYLGFKSHSKNSIDVFSEARNLKVLEKNDGKVVGLDVSEYQGEI